MPKLTIGGTVINFPATGRDAVWSDAVTDFASAVTDQLSGLSGQFDINPKVQTLSLDQNTNLAIANANFPSGSVRGFNFQYSIYRTNGVTHLAEKGSVIAVYNTGNASWELEHNFIGDKQASGESYTSFSMSGDQLTISTVAMGGSYDGTNSKLSYSCKTDLVSA